jgi:phosphoribosyl-ATP pyrophosphohydrolase
MKERRITYRSTRTRSRDDVAGFDKAPGRPSSQPCIKSRSTDLAAMLVPGARDPAQGLDYSNSPSADATAAVLEELHGALARVTAAEHPRTFKALRSGRRRLARKLIEEACEVTVEVVKRDARGIVSESADLLYQLVVLWFRAGIEPIEIWREMRTRADMFGIAEKLPKVFDLDAVSIDLDC